MVEVKKLWYLALIACFTVFSVLVFSLNARAAAAEIDRAQSDRLASAPKVTIAKNDPKFLGIPLACYAASAKAEANPQAQAVALIEVAQKYAKAGQKDRAAVVLDSSLDYLKGWDDASTNAFVRVKIATEYMDADRPKQAISALEQSLLQIKAIEDAPDRTLATVKVASQYAKLGEIKKANALLEQALTSNSKIKDPYAQTRVLLAIAAVYNKLDNADKSALLLAQSLPVADKIEPPAAKSRALLEVAKIYAITKHPEQVDPALSAAAIASGIPGDGSLGTLLGSFNSRALAYVASEYATAGDYDRAINLAKRIADPYERAIAFIQIATKYTESNQNLEATKVLEEGLNAGKTIIAPLAKANSFAEVAKVYDSLGKKRIAQKTLSQSLQVLDLADNNDDKVILLLDISNQYAEMGDRIVVGSLLQKIQDILLDPKSLISNKAGELANVALIYSAIGDRTQAMSIAKVVDRQYANKQLVSLLECASQPAT
jgi:tetratricopeptide (TPR) repeat protein